MSDDDIKKPKTSKASKDGDKTSAAKDGDKAAATKAATKPKTARAKTTAKTKAETKTGDKVKAKTATKAKAKSDSGDKKPAAKKPAAKKAAAKPAAKPAAKTARAKVAKDDKVAEVAKADKVEDDKPAAEVATAEADTTAEVADKVEAKTEKVDAEVDAKADKVNDEVAAVADAKKAKPKTAAKGKRAVKEEEQIRFYGTGRRKEATARVFLRPGTGEFVVNKKPIEAFFPRARSQMIARQALKVMGEHGESGFDVYATVVGGGESGQAEAVRHGVSRAMVAYRPDCKPILRAAGFIARDARAVERKKVGLRKARRARQYSKR